MKSLATSMRLSSASADVTNFSFTHHFDHRLDTHYLNDFYEEDWESAAVIFKIFLQNTVEDCHKVIKNYLSGNYHTFYQLVHKIRPSFRMVGLSELDDEVLHALEFTPQSQIKSIDTKKIIALLKEKLNYYLPIIHKEALRLARFLTE